MTNLPLQSTPPLERLVTYLSNRESVARAQGFTAVADDFAEQVAAFKAMRDVLLRIRNEPALLKTGGRGGQDQYAGVPPAYRLIDSVIPRDTF